MLEVRPDGLTGVVLGGAVFLLDGTQFHQLDPFHFLKYLLTFMSEEVHARKHA